MSLKHFTTDNFTSEVLASPIPVLVYFTTPHCQPCKLVTPIVRQLADDWQGQVKVGEIDIYESFSLTLQHMVMKAPTLLLFVDGKVVSRVMGFLPKDKLVARLAQHLGDRLVV